MKKILFIALGLLMAVTSFGQDSLTTDSTQMIQGDTVSIHNCRVFRFQIRRCHKS